MIQHVLIAEDARDIAKSVAYGVKMLWPGCTVTIVGDGREALHSFQVEPPDLVILDVMMPPPDGFEVCRRIRAMSQVPILMLTVRDATLDKVQALDLGADDYLTKPFDPLELLARLKALVLRSTQQFLPPGARLQIGEVELDSATRTVCVHQVPIHLTSTEYRLLEELMRHAGHVLSHHYLLEQVWGPEYTGSINYLKVFIRQLRQKLGDDPDQPRYIQTEWGVGYRFAPVQ